MDFFALVPDSKFKELVTRSTKQNHKAMVGFDENYNGGPQTLAVNCFLDDHIDFILSIAQETQATLSNRQDIPQHLCLTIYSGDEHSGHLADNKGRLHLWASTRNGKEI